MLLLDDFIALAIALSIIAFCGHMTFRSAIKSISEGTGMNTSWLTLTVALWLIALSTPYTERVSALLIISGPIAFAFGFTFQVARQTIKKHLT